ncbi:STY4526/YPO1902 family pathogenicity island replication protein [Thiorhodococcus minor]|uniref:DUF2857 family protein n=1 Tax=Thiorhodococcus minor TaxID=57489 RepID=A0A6M0JY54_9GAMM|nr:DUF2857 family protein [Thiorhodococcus minor]
MERHAPSAFILHHVTRLIHAGNYEEAMQWGFDWDEIRLFEALSLQDFHWLETRCQVFIDLEIRINHPKARWTLQRLAEQRRTLDLQTRLLQAGAPRHLMGELYGWPPQQYRDQRKRLGLDDAFPNGGRPANPSVTEEEAILAHWERLADRELAERYLETALATQVSVRQVCRALSLREEREREALGTSPSLPLRNLPLGALPRLGIDLGDRRH